MTMIWAQVRRFLVSSVVLLIRNSNLIDEPTAPRRWVCFTLSMICLSAANFGCSRKFYRTQADRDVAAIYAEKRREEAYTLPPLPGIQIDPRSRLFDPSPKDCPALPDPVPRLYGYQLPGLMTGNPDAPRSPLPEADEELEESLEPYDTDPELILPDTPEPELPAPLVETVSLSEMISGHTERLASGATLHPPGGEVRLAQLVRDEAAKEADATNEPDAFSDSEQGSSSTGLRIVPIPQEYWGQIPETCVPRMLEFESVRKEFERSFEDAAPDTVDGLLSDAPRLTLPMITELASLNSRELQTRKERLYRVALALTAQQYEYLLRPTRRGNGSGLFYTHQRVGNITQNGLRIPTTVSVTKTTAIAGQFLAGFANSVVLTFNGTQGFVADVGSELLFDFQQSIFQRDVVFEALTQAERDVVYEARDLIRFQRGLFVDLATRYYELLLTYREIEISSQDYFSNLRAFLQGRAEYLQAGRIPRFQVDQFEQNALQSRSALVQDCNRLETALDRLKLVIGLPPEMPLNLNLTELESLTASDELTVTRQLVFRTKQTLIDATESQLGDRDAAVNGATVLIKRLAETLRVRRQIEGVQGDREAEIETARLGRRLALLDARLQADQLKSIRNRELKTDLPPPPLIQFARTVDLIEAQLLESRRAADYRRDIESDPAFESTTVVDDLGKRLEELRGRWDAAIQQRQLDQLPGFVAQAENLLNQANRLTARFVDGLLPTPESELDDFIVQVVADTVDLVDRVETSGVGGLDEVDVQDDEAMLLALFQRMEVMNRRGELADARRRIKLAADDLKAILDVRATQLIRTRGDVNRGFDFGFGDSETRLSLALDTPLNRRLERNAYRAALINYNAVRRDLIEQEDEIKFEVREDLRQLRLLRNQYEISVASAALAYERVVSTRLQLQLAIGNVVARDFLEAQQAYTASLSAVARQHISFIRGRIDLFFDTESIRLDANGYWSGGQQERLDLPPLPDFSDANPNPYGRLPPCLHYSEEVRRDY